MWDNKHQKNDPGQDPALVVQRSLPARRQVSIRWLTGTVLTGATSCILMGIALLTALDGQHLRVTLPQWFIQTNLSKTLNPDANGYKEDRIVPTYAHQSLDSKRKFELSILQQKGNEAVIQTQNFEWIRMTLAEVRPHQYTYPKFDALSLVADNEPNQLMQQQNTGSIYIAKVPTKITLRNYDFLFDTIHFDGTDMLTHDEVQQELKKAGFPLEKTSEPLSILTLLDPLEWENLSSDSNLPEVRIIQENVTISPQNHRIDLAKNYTEDIIPIHKKQTILDAFKESNYTETQVQQIAKTLTALNQSDTLKKGSFLRIGIITQQQREENHLVRASIYQGTQHILTVAVNDKNQFVKSTEPEMSHTLKTAFQNGFPHSYVSSEQLPTVYDAIYHAVLDHNIPHTLSQRIIRLLATNIDMKSRITPTDQLEIFYAVPQQKDSDQNNQSIKNGKKEPQEKQPVTNTEPEIRYISATFGNVTHKYYRHQSKDGSIDYYDAEGKNSRPFLIRKPTPNGYISSSFGPRKHPVLGYVRMHTGVDWAAPKGSPIVAAGDGVVTKMEATSGYGNHTVIQHANGYTSSYSHQNTYAPGIKPGVKVRQGQVIGYVGSTGLATGPHCHFEVIVNGKKVDPMRIRLPDSKTLIDQELQAFLREKNNIDSLLNNPTTQSEAAS
ncbi:M23 family metallopeptidase [Bartonella sp. A05]|uniref:M23 family metallopeptidase n=1 Tax=Bartonella sp. A05 TaxID=2967261 RepID=UPI0022A92527|nr:M23 family metallopeptidase [Bartonella sp. A05]MCZ2203737.1 M23 family metallopeptidase [Bartonella sp. A05]